MSIAGRILFFLLLISIRSVLADPAEPPSPHAQADDSERGDAQGEFHPSLEASSQGGGHGRVSRRGEREPSGDPRGPGKDLLRGQSQGPA